MTVNLVGLNREVLFFLPKSCSAYCLGEHWQHIQKAKLMMQVTTRPRGFQLGQAHRLLYQFHSCISALFYGTSFHYYQPQCI